MKIIVNLFFLLICLVSCTAVENHDSIEKEVEHNDILASFIMDQWTFEGTRLQLFLHAVVPDPIGLTFEILEAPDWVHISNKGTRASILMDAPMGAEGEYNISIAIKQNNKTTHRKFILEVQKRYEKVLFVDPVNGKKTNDGSEAAPLATIPDFSTMKEEKGALLVLLKSGVYETLNINHNPFLTLAIQPLSGHEVIFKGAEIDSCTNVSIRSCTFIAHPDMTRIACVEIGSAATKIHLENIHIQSDLKTEQWRFDDWKQKSKSGIYNYGKSVFVSNSLIDNVFHGLENKATQFNFYYNIVDRFAGDALRNTGSHCVFSYNMLKNALIADYAAPDGNHDDLYQSWTFDEPIVDVILSHNIAIDIADKDLKLAAKIIGVL